MLPNFLDCLSIRYVVIALGIAIMVVVALPDLVPAAFAFSFLIGVLLWPVYLFAKRAAGITAIGLGITIMALALFYAQMPVDFAQLFFSAGAVLSVVAAVVSYCPQKRQPSFPESD